MVLRLQRLVFRTVVGRFVVRSGIDPEHREVAGVTRPHPVVGVCSEFAYGGRRCSDKTDVTIDLIHYEQLHIVVVE